MQLFKIALQAYEVSYSIITPPNACPNSPVKREPIVQSLLTKEFIDKLTPNLPLLDRLENTKFNIRHIEKSSDIREIYFDRMEFLILINTIHTNIEELIPKFLN